MRNTIEALIEQKIKQIDVLASEISDLMDRQVFENPQFKEDDKTIKIKTGRKKSDFYEVKIKEGRRHWTQDYIDEDTGKVFSIERTEIVSINGKRVDWHGRAIKTVARLYNESENKKVWEE